MSITFAGVTFDHVVYDDSGDVLYLHVGDPASARAFDESPEGHALRFDAMGNLVGITIMNAKWLLEKSEPFVITVHERVTVDRSALASLVQAA
jgi:uncharacterized protein YuzE